MFIPPINASSLLCGFVRENVWEPNPKTCVSITVGSFIALTCGIALFIIGALGVAGLIPVTPLAGSTIGLSAGICIATGSTVGIVNIQENFETINQDVPHGRSLRRIAHLLTGMIFGTIPIVLAGLGFGGILSAYQIGIGLLVMAAPFAVAAPYSAIGISGLAGLELYHRNFYRNLA